MKITSKGIRNAGTLDHERLVLRADEDLNIGSYAVLASRLSDKRLVYSGPTRNAYFFPDKEVRAGDLVVLYSKTGKASEKVNDTGVTSHFFYWGLSSPLWVDKTAASLLEVAEWRTIIADTSDEA